MTKISNATFAAALVAASVFGGSAAFASGDYYQGANAEPAQSQNVDRFTTQSISNGSAAAVSDKDVGPANGDYFQGVSKDAR